MATLPYISLGGKPLKSASAFNAMLDAARANARTQPREEFEKSPNTLPHDQATHVACHNTSGQSLRHFAIVGFDGFTFDPGLSAESEKEVLDDPILQGTWPATNTHSQRWGIALNPAAPNEIVKTVASGLTLARVVADAVAGDVVGPDADTGHLEDDVLDIVSNGLATVISCASGATLDSYYQWALIRIGGGGGGGGNQWIDFVITSWLPDISLTIGCEGVYATVTATSCQSIAQEGDEVVVWDPRFCWFNLPTALLPGTYGTAFWGKRPDDMGDVPCVYGPEVGSCMWIVKQLCCREEVYGE